MYNIFFHSDNQIVKSIMVSMLLACIIFACSPVPGNEQLISLQNDGVLTRCNGDCRKVKFNYRQIENSLPGLSPDKISIFDWNMQKGLDQNWTLDFSRLSHGKDIIFLQEASLNEKFKQILNKTNMYWNMNAAFKYKGVETGVVLASKVQPLFSCGLRKKEPLVRIPKTILINRYKIIDSAQALLVANIHGINFSPGTGSYQEQFNDLLDILKMHEGPMILAGDFNSWSKKRTRIMEHLAENLSLKMIVFNDEGRTRFFGNPVDHIFYRGLEAVSHAVHPVRSSDHNPISVAFRIPQT